jgi:hypothetical protein
VWIGVKTALSPRAFVGVNVALSAIWLGLALWLGASYEKKSATR